MSASLGNLGADLIAAVGGVSAGFAVVVDATGGTLAGHTYLVVDYNLNGVADPTADYVIDITGAKNLDHLSLANFI
ncbi:MAG: hypothetical protein ACREHE_15650 [Rhizomicrobium sp.]